jgi:hypothetical protein
MCFATIFVIFCLAFSGCDQNLPEVTPSEVTQELVFKPQESGHTPPETEELRKVLPACSVQPKNDHDYRQLLINKLTVGHIKIHRGEMFEARLARRKMVKIFWAIHIRIPKETLQHEYSWVPKLEKEYIKRVDVWSEFARQAFVDEVVLAHFSIQDVQDMFENLENYGGHWTIKEYKDSSRAKVPSKEAYFKGFGLVDENLESVYVKSEKAEAAYAALIEKMNVEYQKIEESLFADIESSYSDNNLL